MSFLLMRTLIEEARRISMGGNKMRRRRIFGIASFAILAAVVMISYPVSASWVLIAEGYGVTSVSPSGCSAAVDGYVRNPASSGDDVTALYHVSWSDTRTSGQRATHYFNITVSYSQTAPELYKERREPTDPGGGGNAILNITIYGVQSGWTINVIWRAWVNAPSQCYAEDWDSKTITIR